MSSVRSSELQYAACILSIATLWAIGSFVEHTYFDEVFKHTPTSGLLLSAGARLFLILAFRWRGAFAVAALMVAYKFHDGSQETAPHLILLIGLLWGVVPYITMELTSWVWRTGRDFQKLKRKHLFIYAWTDSLAVFGLSLLQLKVYSQDMTGLAFWISGAIAALSNFLGIVLLMSVTFFLLKMKNRSNS